MCFVQQGAAVEQGRRGGAAVGDAAPAMAPIRPSSQAYLQQRLSKPWRSALLRRLGPSTRVNLNLYWSDLEKLMTPEGRLIPEAFSSPPPAPRRVAEHPEQQVAEHRPAQTDDSKAVEH